MENNNSSDIGQRISELMFRLKINQRGLGEKIGVSHTTVRNVVNNITKPRYEFLESVLNAYPNINKDWLISGNGTMFIDTKSEETHDVLTESSYLMEAVKKIEESFREVVNEQKEIIKNQRFIIDTLQNQLSKSGNFNDPTTGETEVIRMYTDAELHEIQNPKKLATC